MTGFGALWYAPDLRWIIITVTAPFSILRCISHRDIVIPDDPTSSETRVRRKSQEEGNLTRSHFVV